MVLKTLKKSFANELKAGGLKNLADEKMKIAEELGHSIAVQKDFGDVKLLVRRVSKEELDKTPLAEVVESKLLSPAKE